MVFLVFVLSFNWFKDICSSYRIVVFICLVCNKWCVKFCNFDGVNKDFMMVLVICFVKCFWLVGINFGVKGSFCLKI